jgi:hypothetical protein
MLEITDKGQKLFIELKFPFLWIGVTMDILNTSGITDCERQRLHIYFIGKTKKDIFSFSISTVKPSIPGEDSFFNSVTQFIISHLLIL